MKSRVPITALCPSEDSTITMIPQRWDQVMTGSKAVKKRCSVMNTVTPSISNLGSSRLAIDKHSVSTIPRRTRQRQT